MNRAAIYYRVSGRGQTVEHQKALCRRLCDDRRWEYEGREIEERGSGGGGRFLAGWQAVLQLAQRRQIDFVVCWSLDRIGRAIYKITDSIRMLDGYGVQVITVKEPWLNLPPDMHFLRKLLLDIFEFMAAFERQRIADRTIAAIVTARARGRQIGRPKVMQGDPLDDAVAWHVDGLGWSEITRRLRIKYPGQWGKKGLHRGTVMRAVGRKLEKLRLAAAAAEQAGGRR